MNLTEIILSGFFSIFSSFSGAFAGGGSTPLLLSFLILTSSSSFLTLLALSKIGATTMVLVSGNIHRKRTYISKRMLSWAIFTSILGIAIGTYFVQFKFNEALFKSFVAGTLVFLVIYQLFFSRAFLHKERKMEFSPREYLISGLVFLCLNVINGITGGMGLVFVAFYTAYLKMSYIQAAAYSIMAGIPVLGAQALYLYTQSAPSPLWVLAVVLGSIVGGYLGTRFQYLKGDLWVKRATLAMLLIMAVLLFF